MRDEGVKFPWVLLGFLIGVIVGVVLSDALGHAQSWSPQPDGGIQWRTPNQYNQGGYSYGSQGPQWDYGGPKYAPSVPGSSMGSLYGVPLPSIEESASVTEQVQALTARLKAQQQATCAEVVRVQKFLEALGGEPTPMKGGCDQ